MSHAQDARATSTDPLSHLRQLSLRGFGLNQVEGSISAERELKLFSRATMITQRVIDHPGVKEDARITRSQTFGLLDGFGGFAESALFEETPGQRIIGQNIRADRALALHNFQRFIELRVVVRPEQSQLPRIKRRAAGVVALDKFNQLLLLLRFVWAAELCVKISKGDRLIE